MAAYRTVLINFLSYKTNNSGQAGASAFSDHVRQQLFNLNSFELAEIFVNLAYLRSSLQFLKEEQWLQKKKCQKEDFKSLLKDLFKVELSPISFLQASFNEVTSQEVDAITKKTAVVEKCILEIVRSFVFSEQHTFARKSLDLMSKFFLFEAKLTQEKKDQGLNLGLSLYRSFDGLDVIFDLDYKADLGMKTDLTNTERLYEGAGVGVQSSYSTVLSAIHNINPAHGACFIDLGSGYGRVGLVVGLLRPDIKFIGYEYVDFRVQVAQSSSERLGLKNHVHFLTQDLSSKDFQIPEADIYYMYDPFSAGTYSHVLSQLISISRHRKITIATKGNAREWVLDLMQREGWTHLRELDGGNLCLFGS